MGRKNVVKSHKMFDSGNIAGNITSSQTSVLNIDTASIHLVWAGTAPDGVITVEATNSNPDANTPATVWHELDFGSAIEISGNSGEHTLLFNELPFNAIRIVFTSTSGTGSLDATITAKTTGS